MARWSGWGAVPEVFDERRDEFAWARDQLAGLLTPPELGAAARSSLNAHYTDAALVQSIWAAAAKLGFPGGQVLEPGCGSFCCIEVSHRFRWLSLMSARHEA